MIRKWNSTFDISRYKFGTREDYCFYFRLGCDTCDVIGELRFLLVLRLFDTQHLNS